MYPIFDGETVVGEAHVEKIGLYYRFQCISRPKHPGRYRIYLQVDEKEMDLGICVPEKGTFCLRRSIPAKYIPSDQMRFVINQMTEQGDLLSVRAHERFPQLMRLKTARLVNQSGLLFIRIGAAPDPQDSDRIREYLHK